MTKHLLPALIICFLANAHGQDSESPVDSSSSKFHVGMVAWDFGFTKTNGPDEWATKSIKSFSFTGELVSFRIPIQQDHLDLKTGFGLNYKVYSFDDQYTLVAGPNSTVSLEQGNPTLYDPNANVTASRLRVTYLHFPMAYEYRFKNKKDKLITLSTGINAGWRLAANHRIIGSYNNKNTFTIVEYNRKSFQTNPLTVEWMFRATYDYIGLFVAQNLTPLFRKDAAPKMQPLHFGISILLDPSKAEEQD